MWIAHYIGSQQMAAVLGWYLSWFSVTLLKFYDVYAVYLEVERIVSSPSNLLEYAVTYQKFMPALAS